MSMLDKCIAILAATNDGNNLSPPHLAMVQTAANHGLSERGEALFEALYRAVMAGEYDPLRQALCGVENLTQDHEGYVYWRGIRVEHFSHATYERKQQAAQHLAAACLALEAKGFPVTGRTAISEEFAEAPADTPWLGALQRYYAFFEKAGSIKVVFYPWKRDEAVALEQVNGEVRAERHVGAYEAFHAICGTGYTSLDPRGYESIAGLLGRSGLTPAAIHQAIA
jgi:hypothetical protein